ncbi:hypothetical protein HR12_30080, partial [Microbacterium sp. SUBG005]
RKTAGAGLNLIDTIKRNISLAGMRKLVKGGFVDGDEEYLVANRYRKSMNIKAPTVDVVVGKLSGGNQQKVVLSQWLFSDPEVLILDEPTRGIDVGAKYEIYTIINSLAAQGRGCSSSPRSCPSSSASATASTPSAKATSPASCPSRRPPRRPSWCS